MKRKIVCTLASCSPQTGLRRGWLTALIAWLVLSVFAPCALAQAYPDKPVRLVVAFPAGGPADIGMRIVADRLSTQTGQNFVVDNRPGAGGTIGADLVASAVPDGYTLLLSGNHLVIARLLTPGARYDAVKSFIPVARFGVLPSGLFVSSASPYASVQELLAHALSHPGGLAYASGGNGTPSHLAMELLKRRAGVDIRHIPYKGTPPAIVATLSTEIGRAVKDPGVMKRMEDAGLTPGLLPWAELLRKVEDEAGVYAKVVKEANIRAE